MTKTESGAHRLDYSLYHDAGRTVHWGDTSGFACSSGRRRAARGSAGLRRFDYGPAPAGP